MVVLPRETLASLWRRVVWGRRYRRFRRTLVGPKLLVAFADAYPSAYFVEIGANDGQQSDQLREQVEDGSWHGLMVEPQAEPFSRLSDTYGGEDRLTLENVAISDHDGTITMYSIAPPQEREDGELLGSYDLLGSVDKEALLSHEWVSDGEQRISSQEVSCLTLASLFEKHGVDALDLMLVDTEGYDFEIVRQLDAGLPRPRLLIYEHCLMAKDDRARCRELVERLGYEVIEEMLDSWCLDTAIDDELTALWRRLAPEAHEPVYVRDRVS